MIAFMPRDPSPLLRCKHFNFREFKVKTTSLFCMIIKKPDNLKVMEWPTYTTWFEEDDILYVISNPTLLEETKKVIEDFKRILGGKKVCLLAHVTHPRESPRELRDYAALEIPKFIKAIAMVSGTAIGKMLANLFFTRKIQPYAVEMFNIKKYL
ncbi:MAG: hypothetical protein V4635_01730 [Bacteroidota bacterium]